MPTPTTLSDDARDRRRRLLQPFTSPGLPVGFVGIDTGINGQTLSFDSPPDMTIPAPGTGMGGGGGGSLGGGFGASIGDVIYPDGPGGQGFRFTGTGWVPVGDASGGGATGGGEQNFGGGGGFYPLAPTKFSEYDYTVPGAPSWWKALQPDRLDANSEYQTFANLLIPFLSPEDQRTVATHLYQNDPDNFGHFNPELLDMVQVPRELNSATLSQYYTGERASKALEAFDQLLSVSGKELSDFGPGYSFLRGLADTIKDYKFTSGATQLTEMQQQQMLSALDPMLSQTSSGPLSAFGPLARAFTNPFFSSGSLFGRSRNKFGDLVQTPNPRYYG